MIEHAWTVVCSKSSVDNQSNNISLFEILEQINLAGSVPSDAVLPMSFDIVSLWYRIADGLDQASGRVLLVDPANVERPLGEFTVDLNTNPRMRTIHRVNGLPINGRGTYFFRIELRRGDEWNIEASIPLQVDVEAR